MRTRPWFRCDKPKRRKVADCGYFPAGRHCMQAFNRGKFSSRIQPDE